MEGIQKELRTINFHFGISEMHTWQTSDKTNRRQWLTWISASSRLSGGANGRRKLRRSEWSTCCTMPPSTTRYESLYKSQNLPHWRKRWSLKRQRPMSITFSSTKTIKLPTGEQTVRLPTIIHCYLLTHCLKDGPVAAVIMANVVANVANLMSEATAPHMGKLVTSARVLIISKLFVIPRLQPRPGQSPHQSKKSHPQRHGSTGSYSGQGKGGGNRQHQKKKTPKKPLKQKVYAVTFKNSVPSGVTTTSGGRERETR